MRRQTSREVHKNGKNHLDKEILLKTRFFFAFPFGHLFRNECVMHSPLFLAIVITFVFPSEQFVFNRFITEEKFLSGSHSQQLEQMADMFSLKAAMKRKALDCNLRDICHRSVCNGDSSFVAEVEIIFTNVLGGYKVLYCLYIMEYVI